MDRMSPFCWTFHDDDDETTIVQEATETIELHHGGEGAAKLHIERIAEELGATVVAHAPNWKLHGRAAGPLRGKSLVAAGDLVIALWDGKSPGTCNEIKQATRQGKELVVLLASEQGMPYPGMFAHNRTLHIRAR